METKNQISTDQVDKRISGKAKISPINFLIGFIVISSILAFIIGGIILGHEKNNKTTNKKGGIISVQEIPNNPSDWGSYKLKSTGMELKLSEKLSKKGSWNEEIIKGDKGNVWCFGYKKSNNKNCQGDEIKIGGSSNDFKTGENLVFTDLQGFTNKNGTYFAKSGNGKIFSLKNITLVKFESENGVEIIKVLGVNSNGNPVPGTPGNGYIGAIINTKNEKYPGFIIQMKINSDVSELEFDQILKSLKYTN